MGIWAGIRKKPIVLVIHKAGHAARRLFIAVMNQSIGLHCAVKMLRYALDGRSFVFFVPS